MNKRDDRVASRDAPPKVSVVVPVYNEEDSVWPLYRRVSDSLPASLAWELLFVDDGSSDASIERLEDIARNDCRVKVIQFRRNYGQTPAMVAGIEHASGAVIVTMDGDLQNDPADIPRFLEHIQDGYDIVVGWREKRQDALITRKVPSWLANRLIGRITGVPIKDNGCSLKAYRRDVIQKIPLYSEMHRFIPAMASLAGTRILEIPVRHHARAFGESKYGLKRIYKVALDLFVIKTLLAMIGTPIKFFAWWSFPAVLISATFLIATLISSLQGELSLVFLGIAILWGISASFSLISGLLAELLYRTSAYKESYLAKLTVQLEH